MAATPEGKVKKQIKVILQEHGVYYVMPMGTGYGNSGVPDFICCAGGRFVGIEAKSIRGTVTALQDKNLSLIQAAGGIALIVNEGTLDLLRGTIKLLKDPSCKL